MWCRLNMSLLLGYGPAKVDVGIHVPAASRVAQNQAAVIRPALSLHGEARLVHPLPDFNPGCISCPPDFCLVEFCVGKSVAICRKKHEVGYKRPSTHGQGRTQTTCSISSRHARWADAGLSQANMYQPNDILTNACPVLPVPTVAGNQNFDFWVLHDTFLRSLSIKGNQQLESLCTAWVMVDLGNVARRMLTGGLYPALYKRLLCPRSNISSTAF